MDHTDNDEEFACIPEQLFKLVFWPTDDDEDEDYEVPPPFVDEPT